MHTCKQSDVIDPSQINITRICLLGSILKSYDILYEFLISHEDSRNEWGTFFNKNYRKEINKLQVIAFQVKEEDLPRENNREDIQRILRQDFLSEIDRNTILLECMNKPDSETVKLLEMFLQKFFLDLDIMSEVDDYILAAAILFRLPKEDNENIKKEIMLKLKNVLINSIKDWRKIIGFLTYIVGDDLVLYVQFFEVISSESDVVAEPDFLAWMTEQQLMLPLDSGWKLYQAKAHLINQKYETYETQEAHLEG